VILSKIGVLAVIDFLHSRLSFALSDNPILENLLPSEQVAKLNMCANTINLRSIHEQDVLLFVPCMPIFSRMKTAVTSHLVVVSLFSDENHFFLLVLWLSS